MRKFSIAGRRNRGKATAGQTMDLLRFWKDIRSVSVSEIAQEAERPVRLTIVGGVDHARLLAARLALESVTPQTEPRGPAQIDAYLRIVEDARDAVAGEITLDADALTSDEGRLAQALADITLGWPELRLSLARHIPAFRPAVAAQLIAEIAWTNARIAALSALPGFFPLAGLLAPATAAGDMLLLTKNQVMMLLRLAAAYGLSLDLRERTRELLPVVGSAFGWRALARQLVGLIPGGAGIILKGSIAYGGTYTVGKAAQIYFSTGQSLSGPRLQQLGRDAAQEARAQLQEWIKRGRSPSPFPGRLQKLLGRGNVKPEHSIDTFAPLEV